MNATYTLRVAGLTRELNLYPIGGGLHIAGFVMIGDVELTERCAEELLAIAPDYDYLITAESKGIPLCCTMARQHGDCIYFVARKQQKLYMRDCLSVPVNSITTAGGQWLFMDGGDAEKLRGKRVLIVDDVVSTGESLHAVERLVEMAGGIITGRMTVLAEGDAVKREDLTYLAPLPLFDSKGQEI